MGGMGSGRRYQGGKDTTDDMHELDVRRLQRDGLLRPGQSFSWQWLRRKEVVASINIRTEANRVILDYRTRKQGGEWQPMNYPVLLEWTGCHFGGRRAWFRCPARGCGRRVAILYGGSVYACRHCHKLNYACQREADYDRSGRRADKLRKRLNWEPGFLNGTGVKPKGMHWKTFWRLQAEHNVFVNTSLAAISRRFRLMNVSGVDDLLNRR